MSVERLYKRLNKVMIERYIREGQEERLTLEFKTVTDAKMTDYHDRQNFAEAMSGFANSSGGLIIWGVHAAKNSGDVDCARRRQEIKSLKLFVSRLNSLTGQLVCPHVDGVVSRGIKTTNNGGFAVTLVPESLNGPHMAQGRNQKRYYKRSGDSFYPMEHFDVADMFGRRKKPRLFLHARISKGGRRSGGGTPTTYTCHIILGIQNTGRGTAKYPYLAVNVHQPYKVDLDWGLDGNSNHGLPLLVRGGGSSDWIRFGAGAEIVVHPDTVHEVTRIKHVISEGSQTPQDVVIEWRAVAEDMRQVEGTTVVGGSEISDRILPKVDS